MQTIEQFREVIRAANLQPPNVIEPGKFYRIPGEGKRKGNTAAWCKLFPDGKGGIYGDYSTGLSTVWQAHRETPYTPAELEASKRHVAEAKAQADIERKAKEAEAAKKVTAIYNAAAPAIPAHPYLVRKGIKAHGLRVYHGDLVIGGMVCDGALMVPMMIGKERHSLQFISLSSDKRFMSGGRTAGTYFVLGTPADLEAHNVMVFVEGFATGATVREAMGFVTLVCFTANNLESVAGFQRSKFPNMRFIIAGDFDESGTGQRAASEAAQAVGGIVALPSFTPDELAINKPPSDWNDYAKLRGTNAVRESIEKALKSPQTNAPIPTPSPTSTSATASDSNGWPEPLPLAAKVEPEPYPRDALPDTIRAAVEEVQDFTKAPVPMVAGAALAALSLAIQSHADIKRADKLLGPVSLFLLTIADSGERKSTCDGFFTSAIRDYQAEQAEHAKPELEKYRAKIAAWEAKRAGMLDAIKAASKQSKPTGNVECELHLHEQEKPEPPKVPKLLRGDDTPENLAFVLAREWPSAGAISAEGGIIFGSHGMGSESAMRNMALLNILWDGGSLDIGRRSKESFTVRGARLTVAIQIQEATLREFFAKSGALARGTGFLARFLIAWPESTQGLRHFTEAPANWPHLVAFNRRIAAILNQPAPIDADGALTPPMLALAPDAKAAWIEYHNAVESELASGGELYDVRDVASKSADNAVRLAALFHVFEHGAGGAVGLDSFEGASRIAAWHLNESRRFFGELALPAELADAARLDTWLTQHCQRKRTYFIGKNFVRQHGPLRDGARLDTAIRELANLERLRLDRDGKHLTIFVNPALVEVAS